MQGLTAQDVLDLWDRCSGMGHANRALALLARAEPEVDAERHAALPAGVRDARILAVRERTLGRDLQVVAECPGCAAPVELAFTAHDLGLDTCDERPAMPVRRAIGGHEIVLRPVVAGDLVAAEAAASVEQARAALLQRCVLSVDGEEDVPLQDELAEAVEAVLEAFDPCADVEIATRCPDCGHQWAAPFDPARFFWQEIEALAPGLLMEVAELARHYHWAERDILAMSAARRRFYLEMAGR
jgi:hypothetical protein